MVSLLLFVPIVILFLAALGILILQQARPSIGYAWLIGTIGGLLAVSAVLFLRWRVPLEVTMNQWQPFGTLSTPLSFRLDLSSWPYLLIMAVLVLAFILTDAARLETEAIPLNWAAGLGIAALGMLAVLASSPITLVVIWTAVDLVDFFVVMNTSAGRRMAEQTVTAFGVRVAGTLLVLLAVLFARSRSIPFTLAPIPASLSIFMIFAAGLRLGVLPLNLPYTMEVYAWRGLGNLMRMVGPASSLVVLGRMPEQVVPPEWRPVLLSFTALAALYGGVMWLVSDNELKGRSYWAIALAALAVVSVINGSPRSSIAWGAALILTGGVVFFYSARRREILFIPILAILGIVGLPFTPAASGWQGLIRGSFSAISVVYFFTVMCLVWGFWRHMLRPRDELYRMERWVHTVYPAGLVFLILGQWAIGVLGWPGSFALGTWWASVAVTLLSAAGLVLAYSLRGYVQDETLSGRWVGVFARRVGAVVGAVFRLNWLYRFIAGIYGLAQNLIQLLTDMLEGDGGILWALVMLAFVISLIATGSR